MHETIIRTTCTRDCPNTCGLLATVRDGRLIRLTGDPHHPLTRGAACAKTKRYVDRVYSPERVTSPLIREASGWRRASWDEALDLVADRLRTVLDESGPEAVLYYQGYGERTALKLLNRYFFNLLGGVTTLRGSLCGGTGQASQNMDLGERISHDPLDHLHSRSMLLWARNPASTNISLVPIIHDIRQRGGRVVLIDPVRTRTAAIVDRHIAPRPGTDVFLAMAAAKLILAAGREDHAFLHAHSEGFETYRAILDGLSVEELCTRSGVTVCDAELVAQTLMDFFPTAMLLGWGLHRHVDAHYSVRAIDALAAIAGTFGVSGGGVSQGFEEYGPYDPQWWGDNLNPPRRTLLMPRIGEEILAARNPRIRFIMVTAANPACMAPDTGRVREAFRSAEFVVGTGHFLDDTADLAHVFLPATTFLEEHDIMASYGHNYVGPVNRAISPVGQCRSEFDMFRSLAARLGIADRFCRPADTWLHDLCAPLRAQGCDLHALRNAVFRCPAPMVPYADRVFPTPSGRFRFLPEFDAQALGTPDPRYPYRLLTVAPHDWICSERTLAEHDSLPEIRLDVDEAARRGLSEGMEVEVGNATGRLTARLRTMHGQRADIAVAERGGWIKAGHGWNVLTAGQVSTVGLGTPYYQTCVNITPHLP